MIGRRGLLALLGGLPFMSTPMRPDQSYDPPPGALAPSSQSGVFVGRRIVVSSTAAGTGFFEYNGTPRLGNPPVAYAVAPSVTADPYGNILPANGGFVSVGPVSSFSQLGSGFLLMQDTNSDLWQISATVLSMHAVLQIESPTLSTAVFIDAVTGSLVGQQPGHFGVPEKWHVIGSAGEPAFGAGFGAAGFVGAVAPAFQFEPINGGRVRLRGDVALTANQVQGAGIVTLPAGYQTATVQQFFDTPNNLSGWAISTGSIVALAAGVVAINCAGTNGNFVSLDGIVIELD